MPTRAEKLRARRIAAITRRVMHELALNPTNVPAPRVTREGEQAYPILPAHESDDLVHFDERLGGWLAGTANVYVEEGDGTISFFTASPKLPSPQARESDMAFSGELLGELLDHLYELEDDEFLIYVGEALPPLYLSKVSLFLEPERTEAEEDEQLLVLNSLE